MKKVIFVTLLVCMLMCCPEVVNAKKINKKKYEYLGVFTLTAYCGCSRCGGGKTSTGKTPKAGRTVAVDPRVIPYGTKLLINGHIYVAEDCGGAIKGHNIDVYFNTHSECLRFGRQTAKVYKKKKRKLAWKLKRRKILWKILQK